MRRLTLTFDNGPTPGVTEQVLDVLDAHAVKATFFLIGQELAKPGRRAIARDAASRGHRLGNHTLTHSVQLGDSDDPDLPAREIGESDAILGELAHPNRYFRPWGDGAMSERLLSSAAIDYLCQGKHTLALWNCVPRDWEDPDGWVETALAAIRSRAWTVLVLHDLPTGAMTNLATFLGRVQSENVEFMQEFPDDCAPIQRGRVIGPLDHLCRKQQELTHTRKDES